MLKSVKMLRNLDSFCNFAENFIFKMRMFAPAIVGFQTHPRPCGTPPPAGEITGEA